MSAEGNRKMLTAIVVDDERLARRELITMLRDHPGIDVIADADSVQSAARAIAELKPDVVFLDIQMPGQSGFDLLDKIEAGPHIVFVTAYDEYAVRAFEVNALDYLMKPVTPERLASCVERLIATTVAGEAASAGLRPDDSLFIRVDHAMKFLRVDTIIAIKAAGDYSQVITTDGLRGLTDKSMNEWEHRLPPNMFCRVHRSAMVNLAFVDRVEEAGVSSRKIHLKGLAEPLDMSRRYYSRLRHLLK